MERPRVPDYDSEKTFSLDYVFDLNRYIDILEKRIEIEKLIKTADNNTVFCATIDKCYAKRNEYFCKAERNCVNKITCNPQPETRNTELETCNP